VRVEADGDAISFQAIDEHGRAVDYGTILKG